MSAVTAASTSLFATPRWFGRCAAALIAMATLALAIAPAQASATHQPAPTTSEARAAAAEQTKALMAMQKRWQQAQGAGADQALAQLLAKAEERRALLSTLLQTHPAEVLKVAIPDDKQAGMPAEVQEKLEQRFETEGELEVLYEDYPDGHHKLRHFLNTPFGERFELHFAGKAPQLPSGARARAQGLLFDGPTAGGDGTQGALLVDSADNGILTLAADGGTTGGSNGGMAAALPNTLGEQKTLVMLVNFQDQPDNRPWTTAQISDTVLGQVSDYYKENSAGQTWLTGVVKGWYTVPVDSTNCDNWAIATAANDAATADGINLADYNRYIYIFPKNSGCGWGGLGTIGGTKTYSWINGTPTLNYIGHELGHNFGLYHAHALDCTDGTLGGTCYSINYGDTLDIMGNPSVGHFNAFEKELLGWFSSTSGASIVTIENSGSYQLGSYEYPTTAAPSTLKILKGVDPATGAKSWYYVELRQATGFDSFVSGNNNVLNGLVIHTASDGDLNSSHLLDMTPGSSSLLDWNDPALTVGQSFTDPDSGLSLTTQWVDTSGATLDVNLGSQPCVAQAPTLSLNSTQTEWVAPGTSVTYSLTLTNHDSLACAGNTYALSAAIPAGWSGNFAQPSVSLAPGASATVALTVTSSSSAADGFYNLDVSANGGGSSATTSITYVVSTPVSNSAPTANADSVTTDAGQPITIDVLANDTDADGNSLSITSFSQGRNGSVMLNADGTLTYASQSVFAGTDSFGYTISDGKGGSASTTVTVTVNAVVENQPPVANDDSASTVENTAVIIPVLANDSDPDKDPLAIATVTQGANGQVQIDADGSLTYTPNKRFKGSDSFAYEVTDGSHKVQAWVTVAVDRSTTSKGRAK